MFQIPRSPFQFMNADIVEFKEFGKMLYSEDIEDKLEDTVNELLSNRDKYTDKMKQASDIAGFDESEFRLSQIGGVTGDAISQCQDTIRH